MGYRTRFIILAIVLLIILGFGLFQIYFSPENIAKTAPPKFEQETVGRGEVLQSVKTSGVVESDKDILVRSPQRSTVKEIYVHAGSKVNKGDLLVELEEKDVQQDIDRLKEQLEKKRNTLEKYQLNKENTKLSLTQGEEVKRNRLALLKKSLDEQEEALETGTGDADRVERTKNEIALAETDLQNLADKNALRLQQMEGDEKNLILQIQTQEQEIANRKQMVQDLRITAPATGVILETSVQAGEHVESEKLLVRMSDFSSYKVVGIINASSAAMIETGDSALVEIDKTLLHGIVGEISQIYDDKMIRFDVHLDDNINPVLEEKKSVALEVISAKRENVLRIKKQNGIENTTQQTVYLVNGIEGTKTEVILGVIGNEWCEVVSGLHENDVILASGSDLKDSPQTMEIK